ncbi:hypothetical protein PILCRDRAFT_805251, partial [Piloderma croceum F 1598]
LLHKILAALRFEEDQVQSNKDLDLPTQQELLAQFRCDVIAVKNVGEGVRTVRREVEGGRVVDGLGASMRGWKGIALERYDRDASRYHQGAYKHKRQDFLTTIDSLLSPLFLSSRTSTNHVSSNSRKRCRMEEYTFVEIVRLARGRCEGRFREGAEEAVVVKADGVEEGGVEWSWEEEMGLRDETKKMVNRIERWFGVGANLVMLLYGLQRNFKKQIAEPVELALNKASPDMWNQVLATFKKTLDKAENTYLTKAKSFDCTEEENATSIATLRKRA